MIHARVLAHYAGCSPFSASPAAILELEASRDRLLALFRKPARQQLREILRELPESRSLLRSFRDPRAADQAEEPDDVLSPNEAERSTSEPTLEICEDSVQVPDLDQWLLRWVHGLQIRAGMFCLNQPRILPIPPSLQDQHQQDVLRSRIGVDLVGGSLQELLLGLSWSEKIWELALEGGSRRERRILMASAPPSRARPKSSLLAMARAAVKLGVDWHVDSPTSSGSMLAVGRGCGLRRVSQKLTDFTSGWGLQLTKQKLQTAQLLSQAGLPGLGGWLVRSLREAVELAEQLGYPVVTKPHNLDQGVGVVTGIQSREELLKAYRLSEAAGTPILLQRHIYGRDFRFYVVRGRLLAALERIPAQVCGDGNSTVRKLVDAVNHDRHKHPINVQGGEVIHLSSIALDQEARHILLSQKLTPDSIPEDGQTVRLSSVANFSKGGSVRECMAEVHPDNQKILEKVSRLCRLDILGIDVIAPSIDEPLLDGGGVICELNGMPGVLPHQLAQPERNLMADTLNQLLMDMRLPPLVLVQGDDDAGRAVATIDQHLASYFPQLAVVDRYGWRQGRMVISTDDTRSFLDQRRALRDPDTDAFVIELAGQSLMENGLPWIMADVLLLLDGDCSLPQVWTQWLSGRAKVVLASPSRMQDLKACDRLFPITDISTVGAQVVTHLRSLNLLR